RGPRVLHGRPARGVAGGTGRELTAPTAAVKDLFMQVRRVFPGQRGPNSRAFSAWHRRVVLGTPRVGPTGVRNVWIVPTTRLSSVRRRPARRGAQVRAAGVLRPACRTARRRPSACAGRSGP